ncbi:MAG: hypothetical protein WAV41_03835 [Microgenomates group bacterium]
MPKRNLSLQFECGEVVSGELITGTEIQYGIGGIYRRSQLLNTYLSHTEVHQAEIATILDGETPIGTVTRTIGGANFSFTTT